MSKNYELKSSDGLFFKRKSDFYDYLSNFENIILPSKAIRE